MEKHYAFIKNGRLENTIVFDSKDDVFAQQIANEQGYDAFVWLDDALPPIRYSSWDGSVFTTPTHEELVNMGITSPAVDAPSGL